MSETVSKEPIAVIGLGCVLPDAPDVETFWHNLLEGKDSVREVPKQRWDASLFYDADREAPDKTYTKIGAFVADDAFDGMLYRMPPKVVEQIDPSQRWALSATRQAFLDAGYATGLKGDAGKEFDRARCAVILGNAMGGEQMKLQTKNLYWPQIEAALLSDTDFQTLPGDRQRAVLERAHQQFKAGVPPVNEDSMPGTLSNVAAGRIANAFNLHGKNFTTDAACASSLAALDSAVDALRDNECDYVVTGGTDRSMDITPYVEFSKIGALSPDGSRPFDKGANGFVMGEGCAIFLLKRLSDAERDGDRIHAVIRGIGGSSDGKGKGITAPNPQGQVVAVRRAYEEAECDPYSIGYLEAHGTSTPVGDPVELTAAIDAFKQLSDTNVPPGSIRVGSVKSNMGHLKSAAGAAGMLKAVLALRDGVIPPSINVRELNPRIEWAQSPFAVATQRAEWPQPAETPRRAAVSSFGFGGTNFHVVFEQHVPGRLRKAEPQYTRSETQNMFDREAFATYMQETGAALEAQSLVLDADALPASIQGLPPTVAFHETGQKPRIRDLFRPLSAAGLPAPRRVGLAVAEISEIPKKLDLAQKAATNPAAARLAFNQGVFVGEGKPQGKVAFLFPGQGTQYVNMGRDLAAKYAIVQNTFDEADDALFDELGGVRLTDILWPTPDTPENRQASEEKLKLTEFTQPAVLAMDVAILRLLQQWGIKPDVVAGHSLGEYGALVAAGVLSFVDALHAVAARGREMAHVEVPDLGKMAAVSADWETVQDAIADVQEYVIPANKNCPSQTVLAGSSPGVDAAVAACQAKGLQAQYLPVSAAFHSEIVAPASEPLRKVLARLGVQPPKVRVISNVGAAPYPDDPEAILDNLATQVASPVEWIGIIERMYEEGVRTFIEVGPKRALTGFALDILKDRDAVAICSNHPKKGGIQHVNELFAFLGAWGFQPRLPELDDTAMYTAQFRDPTAHFRSKPASGPAATAVADPRIDVIADALAGLSRQLAELKSGAAPAAASPRSPAASAPAAPAASTTPAAPSATSTAPAASTAATPPAAPAASTATTPAPGASSARTQEDRVAAFGFNLDDIGISGISVGLPGASKPLFANDEWDRILRGDNLIDALPDAEKAKLASKNIVRLVKGSDGQANFQVIDDVAQVIQLAGRRGDFDIRDWGVDDDLAGVLDRTFQYALAAALEALRDAGIPLQRTYLQTTTGGYLPKQWQLPEGLRDETGIIFASAFPGYDNLIRDISRYLADKYAGRTLEDLQVLYQELLAAVQEPELKERLSDWFEDEFARLGDALPSNNTRYEFNRKFLFNVLSLGHAQVAQFIGARGPNTQMNAACASTTQAVAMAEDWIRTGRCKRVLVLGADDVTSDAMFEWIGAGFLASGAATIKADVAEAALPFDARRHGMIVGMGAVGLVIESEPQVEARGMRPIARLLASEVANSAFHGSRLDIQHISQCMQRLVANASRRHGIDPAAIAAETVFVSHETYTPARGGSAGAEIHALRQTFGDHANKLVIANTKGFTGHPQGAGIEDAIALKMLQRSQVPPIANFRDPDPELGDLNLSKGGHYDVRYALRLAAGFGSQVAMTLTQLVARESERVADPSAYQGWLSGISGLAGATTEVVDRTLRIVDQGPPKRESAPTPSTVPTPVAPATPAPPAVAAPEQAHDPEVVLEKVVALVAQKTGYPTEMLEPDLDMESDLGIDTVKQAELFGELRQTFQVPMREDLQIKDYNTLRKVAQYMTGGSAPSQVPATPEQATAGPSAEPSASQPPSPALKSTPAVGADAALDKVTSLVAEKTGYPVEMLEPDLDMEADLGIDTVKQAELFGELREHFGIPLREDLQLKDYNTLRKVAQYMQGDLAEPLSAAPAAGAADANASPGPQAPSPASNAAATSGAALDSAMEKVIAMVADKTGYPAEMLEPDLDMEADLGIDTVKQAELFGELREHFGIPLREDLQLKDYNTLRKVAQYMQGGPSSATEAAAEGAHADAPREADAAATAPGATAGTVVRRAPALRPEPSPDDGAALQRGAVLVVGDADTAIMDAFKAAGFEPSFRAQDPVGILCIATRPGEAAPARAGALFDAAKTHRERMGRGAFVCVVTSQDGAHGIEHVRDASMAAVAGLGKALAKELPEATTKVIDVHPEWKSSAPGVVDEVLRGGPRAEVCFSSDGTRYVVDVAPDAIEGTPDVAGKHLVVSGGAQGITVEMLAALAPQGPRLLLLGRTQISPEAAAWATWDDARWKQEEQATMERMKKEGQKVTPVSLQKAMSPMRKAAEVQRNLQRLTDLGAEVIYSPVDVTDAAGVAEAMEHARGQFGPVHGIIHAAGVEISKDLASKDRQQFDLVFGIKHDGLAALLEASAEDPLEWLASFGSVAGRFGNIGQTDYSAVNEYLCKAVKQAARERGIQTAFTVAWGPWGEVGMATKGSIMQIMEASGVTPVPTAEGVAQFLHEMATPGIRESVVAGALGAIDRDSQVVEKAWDPEAGRVEAFLAEHAQQFRLLAGVESIRDGHVVASVTLDQATQPFARDHAIDGTPYMPGVFGLEAFAEAASLLAGDAECIRIEHARFSVPLKQLKQRPARARVEVERVSAPEEPEQEFQCVLSSRMVGPDGVERGEPRTHFEATLVFGERLTAQTDVVPPCTRALAKEQIYPPFFHGPSFQVLRYAGPLEDESVGIAAMPYAAAFSEGEAEFQVRPLLVEALFQLCGLRTMQVEERMSLPAAIDRLDICHGPATGELRLVCTYRGNDEMRRFDAMACTADGQVLLRMEGYAMVETGPAPGQAQSAGPTDEAPEPGAKPSEAAVPAAQRAENAPPQEAIASGERRQVQTTLADTVPIPRADVELPEIHDVAFAAVPVADADADPTWFTPEEQEEHAAFKVDKRAAEWRAGRLAAKAAILDVAKDLKPTDIRIQNEESGQPVVWVKGQRLPASLTITHRDGIAIAAVAEAPIGIDLETAEARSSGFHEEAFNAAERELTQEPMGAACVWAAKEAVFKRLGTGLKQALHAWTVEPDGEGGATVHGPDGTFAVRFFDVQGRVLAVTAEAFDPLATTPAS